MTIEQLYYFYAVSIHGTFSNAALEMNITQSALSKQIAKLEMELGIFLFDRSHRQIVLTNEGKQLLKDAKTILKDYEKMMEHLQIIKEKNLKTLKIAMLPIFSQYDLGHKINEFSKQHSDIHLIIDEIEERDLTHKLDYHDYDIYILRGDYDELNSFHQALLYQDSLVCVLSQDHPLAKQKSMHITDLSNEKIYLPPIYTTISQIAIQACHEAGFQPQIARHGRLETILSAVSEARGVALMMKKSLDIFHLSNIQVIPFQEDIQSDIKLYYSSQHEHEDIIKQFVHFIQPHIDNKSSR